jgi:hypothetical protein
MVQAGYDMVVLCRPFGARTFLATFPAAYAAGYHLNRPFGAKKKKRLTFPTADAPGYHLGIPSGMMLRGFSTFSASSSRGVNAIGMVEIDKYV